MRISFTGPQCSGKTTLLEKCKEHYGDKFKYIMEVTRPLAREGYTINEGGNDDTQKAIIDAHVKNIKYDNVIMDRCIIDGMTYSWHFHKKDQISRKTWTYCVETGLRKCLKKMDLIFMTESVEMENDGTRSVNLEFRNEIEKIFDMYKFAFLYENRKWGEGIEFKGKFVYLTGDVDKRFDEVKLAIKEYEC